MPYIKFTEQEKAMANSTSIADYLTMQGEVVKRVGREYVWEAPSGKVSINGANGTANTSRSVVVRSVSCKNISG